MNKISVVMIAFLSLISLNSVAETSTNSEVIGGLVTDVKSDNTVKLSNEESLLLSKIVELHKDIKVSKYANLIGAASERKLKLDFKGDLDDGFYFGEFTYYDLIITNQDEEFDVEYSYSVGQAYTAKGHIFLNKINNNIIRMDYSHGTGAETTQIHVNKKVIFEKTNMF